MPVEQDIYVNITIYNPEYRNTRHLLSNPYFHLHVEYFIPFPYNGPIYRLIYLLECTKHPSKAIHMNVALAMQPR